MQKFLNIKIYFPLSTGPCGAVNYDPNYKEENFDISDMTGRTFAANFLIDEGGYIGAFADSVVNTIANPEFYFDDGSKLTVKSPSGKIVLTIVSESEE